MKSTKGLLIVSLSLWVFTSCIITAPNNNNNSSSSEGREMSARLAYKIEGPENAVKYVEQYKRIAIEESIRVNIPASIKLAQGILESGYGSSELAKKANNHFGIKCGGSWTGKTHQRKGSCFRVFKSGDDAYIEHSKFLTGNSRYDGLFKLKPTDYKGWAHGLKKAGYATSATYPQKLIELIERYKLHNYDK